MPMPRCHCSTVTDSDGLVLGDAGVVDPDVDASVELDRTRGERIDLVGLRHVDRERRGFAAVGLERGDGLGAERFVDLAEDAAGAAFGKGADEGEAEPAAGAGDHRDFSVEARIQRS